ncbi:MAG: chloride channel protein family [Acidimicrobiaceae bacterium]
MSAGWTHRRVAGALPDRNGRERYLVRLLALGRRSRQILLLAAVTGVTIGALVALFDRLTTGVLLDGLRDLPLWVQAPAPLIGLVLAALSLRWVAGGASPSTADEYVRNFHEHDVRLDQRPVLGRVMASMATLGFGGSLGLEGPSIYLGAAVGSGLQRRLSRFFSRQDTKVLLVSGAAAGVAAVFKAPVTGLVFALEVPYQDDLAHRMLLPAAIGAAASYVTFATFAGTDPILPVRGAPPFNLLDLGGAALLGLLCGIGARAFSVAVRHAKRVAATGRPVLRAVGAGVILAGLFGLSYALVGRGLTLGPGYDAIRWALDGRRAESLVVGMLVLRAVATLTTVAGGGAGGLFVPLVVLGVFTGRAVDGLVGAADTTLFPVIGMAAFLGAGYRVPLASVTFVAEFTGRPGFVVPGLIAAVVAQLAMGRSSVSPYQVASRAGHLERRFSLPVGTALETDVLTLPPDATIDEFFNNHLIATRQESVPVVEGRRYLGMVRMYELDDVARNSWETTPVSFIMRDDHPTGRLSWRLGDAIEAMEEADVDRLPIVDDEDAFVGTISADGIIKLDEILGRGGSAESGWGQ